MYMRMASSFIPWRIIVSHIVLILLLAACQSTPYKPLVDDESDRLGTDITQMRYQNTDYLELLQKYRTADGQLDYQAWQGNKEDLKRIDQFIQLLSVVSPKTHPEQFASAAEQRSYWINAYNALVIHTVLQYWPLESVRHVKVSLSSHIVPGKGFFYDRDVVVGGETTNLLKLEKEILRLHKDPRLHFALNCASGSCPVIQPWEWTEEQLHQAAVDFINSPENVKVEDMVLFLSRIFKWYKKDFGEDVHQFLMQYANTVLKEQIMKAKTNSYPIQYYKYDWSLNQPGVANREH